jgi:cell division protein YceG involved in septum cleavage
MADMLVQIARAKMEQKKKDVMGAGTLPGFARDLMDGETLGDSTKNFLVSRTSAGQVLMPDHAEKMDNTRIEGVLRTQLKGQGILGDEQDAIIKQAMGKSLIDDDEEDAPYNTYVQKGMLD